MAQASTAVIGSRTFEVRKTGNKFFYWSPRALRWLPVKAALVSAA